MISQSPERLLEFGATWRGVFFVGLRFGIAPSGGF